MNAKLTIPLLLLCPLALLPGCGGGDFGTVSGKVTLNGQPLPGASVQFQPLKGNRPSVGTTDEGGNYTLKYTTKQTGAEVGEHEVRISAPITKKDKSGEDQVIGNKVPAKYNVQTELKRTVTAGSNQFDFELQGKPRYGEYQPRPTDDSCGPDLDFP